MYIIAFIHLFLKSDFEELKKEYKKYRDMVRKHFDIPVNDKLSFNGFNYKDVIFINGDGCLESADIPIQRMVWINANAIDEKKKKMHIYLYPSFTIKHCPLTTCTLEFIWNACISVEKDPFDVIDDPENVLDSSEPLEYHTERIFKILGTEKYLFEWHRMQYEVFCSLSSETQKDLADPRIAPWKKAYRLIRLMAKTMMPAVPEYGILSFANFYFALK